MRQQRHRFPRSRLSMVLLVLVALLFIALYLLSRSPGRGGPQFDKSAEAYSLAQAAQSYRQRFPLKVNYGLASITVIYDDGTSRRYMPTDAQGRTDPFRGFTSPGAQGYRTHSEFKAHKWILDTLGVLKRVGKINRHVKIAIVIFSQVVVCSDCAREMVSWLHEFRAAAGTNVLELSTWDIAMGKGYDPGALPQGKPVRRSDLEEVPISYTP